MGKSEVKSLVAFICGRLQIFHSLLLGHRTPLLVAGPVPGDIVVFGGQIDDDIGANHAEQRTIAGGVVWRSRRGSFAAGLINVRRDDTTGLYLDARQSQF